MLEDWGSRADTRFGIKSWSHLFAAVLQHIGFDPSVLSTVVEDTPRLQPVNMVDVMAKFDSWFWNKWVGLPADPRSASSGQVLYATYESWFAHHRLEAQQDVCMDAQYTACPAHIQRSAGIPAAHLSSLLRFRLGAHDLPVSVGRWGSRRLPREERVCDRCASTSVGDEFHMVFECSFYAAVRAHFHTLFESFGGHDSLDAAISPAGPYMRHFMSQHKRLLAAFIHTCWLLRCNPSLQLSQVFDPSESDIEVASDDILHVDLDDLLGAHPVELDGQ
jgi:hypothetical protein